MLVDKYFILLQLNKFLFKNKVWHAVCIILIVMKIQRIDRLVTDNYKRFHYDWLVS